MDNWRAHAAGIQYHGLAGITQACLTAIVRLIHFGDRIREARLLTSKDGNGVGSHAFILLVNEDELVAIKSGFCSGYAGEGPTGLALALQLLERHAQGIREYLVSPEIIEKVDECRLLNGDLEDIEVVDFVRPASRYTDYIFEAFRPNSQRLGDDSHLRHQFPAAIPFGVVDDRIMDLALTFHERPDANILAAFRRLEDLVRSRACITGKSGGRLFSEAFQGEDSILYWGDEDKSEHVAKANMFSAVFGAYRNPRAHRETKNRPDELLREFLMINELYLLESRAKVRHGS